MDQFYRQSSLRGKNFSFLMFSDSFFKVISIPNISPLSFKLLKNINVKHICGTPQAGKLLVAGVEGIEPSLQLLES